MSKEAIKYITAMLAAFGPDEAISMTKETWAKIHEAMQALAQPEQEPVAWYDAEKDCAYTLADCEGRAQDDLEPLYLAQSSKPWVELTDEDTYEATGTAGTDLLALAKMWSDNKIHVYQFDNEARKIIEAVLRRASAKLREKNQ